MKVSRYFRVKLIVEKSQSVRQIVIPSCNKSGVVSYTLGHYLCRPKEKKKKDGLLQEELLFSRQKTHRS